MLHLLNDSATVIIAAITLSFTFLFIYYSEGKRYLLLWSIGWGINSISVLFRTLPMVSPGLDHFIILSMALNYASSIFIGLGVYHFVYGKIPSLKLSALMLTVTLLPGFIRLDDPEHALIVIVYTFAGSVFAMSGLVLIRKVKGIGSKVAGTSFIAWSVMMFIVIILHKDADIAYESMQLTVFLTLLSALGIVMMHFEKMRSDLDSTNSILRQLSETNRDIVFSLKLRPRPQIEYISMSSLRLTGFSPEELINNPERLEAILDNDRVKELRKIADGHDIKKNLRDSSRITTKNGTVLTFDLNQTVIYGMDGRPESIIGIARDITEKAQEMDRLASEKTWYELIFKRSGIMTMLVDIGTMTIIDTNFAMNSFYCYQHDEIQKMHIRRLFCTDEDYLDFLNSFDEGLPFQCENLIADGTAVHVTLHSSPLKFDGKNYMFVTVLDNTSESYLAYELSSIRSLHRSILESLNEGVIGINREGTIFFINNSAAEKLGYHPDELLYKDHHSSIHYKTFNGETHSSECEILSCLSKGENIRNRRDSLVHSDGHLIPVVYNFSTLRNESSSMGVLIFRDITEELKSEEMILSSLEENRVLLKELHHRVKNNFQMICSLLSLHAEELDNSPEKDFINECVMKILSMSLTHELLFETNSFSKLGAKLYFEKMLDNLLRASNIMDEMSVSTDIQDISLTLDEAVPCALIINELFTNSVKYAKSEDKKLEIGISFFLQGNEKTLIFSDNGCGIGSIENFGKETSYGLMIIKSLARQLKGTISFENRNGLSVTLKYQ
ncbi:PAS domain S-box protein [Seleniivibrio woodruffii]|uniref:PAS domain-containing sensor histidine kinase n=1 Tax=Seleniivibrio woodruffii TaxID=1078050 RepID=UPI0026EC83C1|nr:PAS domain S-box protein [Seleniivibrio woodruffii]